MHPLDELLSRPPTDVEGPVIAWRLGDLDPASPETIRISRALMPPSPAMLEWLRDDLGGFLDLYGVDSPEVRQAWTEPLEPWLNGSTVVLAPSRPLFRIEWTPVDEEPPLSCWLDAIPVTRELAVVRMAMGEVMDVSPVCAGLISRVEPTRSLALLLSRLETVIFGLDLLEVPVETELPLAELVRLAYAAAQVELPHVLHMSHRELLDLYARDFTALSPPPDEASRA